MSETQISARLRERMRGRLLNTGDKIILLRRKYGIPAETRGVVVDSQIRDDGSRRYVEYWVRFPSQSKPGMVVSTYSLEACDMVRVFEVGDCVITQKFEDGVPIGTRGTVKAVQVRYEGSPHEYVVYWVVFSDYQSSTTFNEAKNAYRYTGEQLASEIVHPVCAENNESLREKELTLMKGIRELNARAEREQKHEAELARMQKHFDAEIARLRHWLSMTVIGAVVVVVATIGFAIGFSS